MDFTAVDYDMERDRGENPLVWYPEGVEAQRTRQRNHINNKKRTLVRFFLFFNSFKIPVFIHLEFHFLLSVGLLAKQPSS